MGISAGHGNKESKAKLELICSGASTITRSDFHLHSVADWIVTSGAFMYVCRRERIEITPEVSAWGEKVK